MIFGLLIVLTVITVAVATQRFENEFVNVCLALLIATIKATFVARYFMHLKFEGKLIWFIFVVAAASVRVDHVRVDPGYRARPDARVQRCHRELRETVADERVRMRLRHRSTETQDTEKRKGALATVILRLLPKDLANSFLSQILRQ